jgi:hypothetical protein
MRIETKPLRRWHRKGTKKIRKQRPDDNTYGKWTTDKKRHAFRVFLVGRKQMPTIPHESFGIRPHWVTNCQPLQYGKKMVHTHQDRGVLFSVMKTTFFLQRCFYCCFAIIQPFVLREKDSRNITPSHGVDLLFVWSAPGGAGNHTIQRFPGYA